MGNEARIPRLQSWEVQKLEDSIAMNEIDGSMFADCIVTKETKALSFKKVRR